MKTQLSALDLYFLSDELGKRCANARIDKAYQIGEKELKLSLYSSGKGAAELIMDPEHVCITSYSSKNPEKPTPFAMQLRKRLKGGFVRSVAQHGFDRILEISIESKGDSYILIAEFFSTGNIVLCDSQKKILGLLERQKWKDRTLKTGDRYLYPPHTADPLSVDEASFRKKIEDSQKKTASVLATDIGLGGNLAEEACKLSGVGKERKAASLAKTEIDALFASYKGLVERIICHKSDPQIIMKDSGFVDVAPMDLSINEAYEKKRFDSFNDAVDEYFSSKGASDTKKTTDDKLGKEISKLEDILRKQNEVITRLEKESTEFRERGDVLYQNMGSLNQLLASIEAEKKKGRSWKDIGREISGKKMGNIAIESLTDGGNLVIRIDKQDYLSPEPNNKPSKK